MEERGQVHIYADIFPSACTSSRRNPTEHCSPLPITFPDSFSSHNVTQKGKNINRSQFLTIIQQPSITQPSQHLKGAEQPSNHQSPCWACLPLRQDSYIPFQNPCCLRLLFLIWGKKEGFLRFHRDEDEALFLKMLHMSQHSVRQWRPVMAAPYSCSQWSWGILAILTHFPCLAESLFLGFAAVEHLRLSTLTDNLALKFHLWVLDFWVFTSWFVPRISLGAPWSPSQMLIRAVILEQLQSDPSCCRVRDHSLGPMPSVVILSCTGEVFLMGQNAPCSQECTHV